MKTKPVIVLPYDPQWPGNFELIRRELAAALGEYALAIEHVGSTSVPGLAAKPIIDLDVVISGYDVLEHVCALLAVIGYEHEGNLGIEGREAFRYSGKEHLQKHHLYVCPQDSRELGRHLAFRDYLRSHPDAVQEYAAAKLQAAADHPQDIDGYIAAKSPCIEAIYRRCGLHE